MESVSKERSKVIAGGAGSSKHTPSTQTRKQKKKINSDASVISQSNSTENRKISKNINKRKGIPRRRLTTLIPATNSTLVESLVAFENRPIRSKDIFEHMRIQSAVQDSHLNWEVNDISSVMNSEVRDFWKCSDMGSDCKKHQMKRNKLKNSSFRFVTFAASTFANEEHTNTVASSNEPDVISLSDEEESQNVEVDMECVLVEQGDDFTKQMRTSSFIKKEVLKCLTASNEIGERKFVDSAEEIDDANVVKNEEIASFSNNSTEKLIVPEIKNDRNRFCKTVKQLPEFNESIKSIQNDINVCSEKKQLSTKLPLRSGPLVVRKDSFDGLNLIPGVHEFVQNGEVELKIEKPEGKDFIQLILFECCGPLEDPKRVARGGYKICTSAVLHENTSVEIVREALIDLAEQLERISRDSFSPGEKLSYCVNKYSLSYLEKQSIYPMKKKSSRFPRAIYYCGLCQFHICSVFQAVVHFLSQEHIDNNEKAESLKKLESLPGPAKEQMFKIEQIIRELYLSTRLTDVQYEDGLQIANLLSHFLQNEAHKSYSVMVYGSYLTKLATLHSNLNLALNFPLEYSLGYALSQVMEVLDDTTRRKNFTVHSITSDFQRPDPSIHCTINSVAVVITANCLRQQRATQLINLYCTICSQFKILITTFRSWAELCSLTNVQLGGMPKFAFDIMLIYYLQRKRLLPFVFEILNEEEILLLDSGNLKFEHQVDKINADFGASNEEWNFGELWIDLFRYYAIEHSVKELIQIRWKKGYLSKGCIRWNKKRFAVEDPFAPDHIMQPQQRIHGYFSSCFLCTYFYFALPRTTVHSLIPYSIITPETVDVKVKKKRKRKSRKITLLNDSNFSEPAGNNDRQNNRSDSDDTDNLYEDSRSLEANKTQITDVDESEQRIATVTETGLETSMQIWSNEIAVSHPEDNLNPNATVFLQKTDENDKNLLVSGKCNDSKKLVFDCAAPCLGLNTSHNNLSLLQRDDTDETYCDRNVMSTFQQRSIHFSELSSRMKGLELSTADTQNLFVKEEYDEKDESAKVKLASISILKIKFHEYNEMSIRKLWLALNNNEYNYPWVLQYFTGGLEPMVRCTCCNADGHLRENCPELMIPKPKNFPPLTLAQRKIIDRVIFDIFNTMRIRPYYVHHMSVLCRELEVYLRRFYRSDCHLSLFGSAGNGFGLLGSDADICLRFGPEVRLEDIDSAEVISKVAEVIRKMPDISFICEIPHAKVPIVKFRCRNHDHLEADVSLYNVLALENTRLLRTYSKLDRRIHQLGIMTKVWAKNCEIGNASKGSLSSYSYIIMLIHYLQRTNPPVAPFLQEVVPLKRCREPVIIGNCDVYFCCLEDLEWTVHNRSTVGELWIGFLDYFGTKFDFTREVVQIRQTLPLMKLDKGWQSRPIAIEDPFDLTHNLSSGVHSKTMAYIQKSFIQSREKFSTLSVPNSKLNHNAFVLYASLLLASCRVGDGPPLDCNCCHRCRQIGHFVVNCPLGMKDKKRNK